MYNISGFQNFASTYSLSGLSSLGDTGANGATGYSPMLYGNQNYWANNILYPLSTNDTNYHLIASWDQTTTYNYSNGIYISGQVGSWRDSDNKTPITVDFTLVWDGTKPYLNGWWDGKDLNNNYVEFIFSTSGSLAYLYMKLNDPFCSFVYTITGGDSLGVVTLQTPTVGSSGSISYTGTLYQENNVGITDWSGSGGNILNVLASASNVWGNFNTDGIITNRLTVNGTGAFDNLNVSIIDNNIFNGNTGVFNNLQSDYLYGTNIDVGNNLLVSSYIDNRTGTGLFGPLSATDITCNSISLSGGTGSLILGNLTTTSIVNSGTMSSGALTLSGSLNAGSNYIQTTGTGSFGSLRSTIIDNNIFIGNTGIFNNLQSDYLYGTNIDVGNNLLVSSYLDNRTGTGLFGPIETTSIVNSGTMSSGALTLSGSLNAGTNIIQTTGTGSFGSLSASTGSFGTLTSSSISTGAITATNISNSGSYGSIACTSINDSGSLTVTGTGTFNNGINIGSINLSTSGILLDTNAQILARYGVLSMGGNTITSYNPNLNITNAYGSSIYAINVLTGNYSNESIAGDTILLSNSNNLLLKSGNNGATKAGIRINTSNNVYIANSLYTTGTGSFGSLSASAGAFGNLSVATLNTGAINSTSITCNGNMSIASGDVYHTNNRTLYWGDSTSIQRPIMWVAPTDITIIRPASSFANVQLQNFNGTALLTVDSNTSTFSNKIDAGSNTIQTTGTGSFGSLSASAGVFGPLSSSTLTTTGITNSGSYGTINCTSLTNSGTMSASSLTTSGSILSGTQVSSADLTVTNNSNITVSGSGNTNIGRIQSLAMKVDTTGSVNKIKLGSCQSVVLGSGMNVLLTFSYVQAGYMVSVYDSYSSGETTDVLLITPRSSSLMMTPISIQTGTYNYSYSGLNFIITNGIAGRTLYMNAVSIVNT